MTEGETSSQGGQVRGIGRWGALSTVAGSMLGVGIFIFTPVVAQNLPSWPGFLSVWLFGGLAALSGAVSYAELGGLFPRAGGDYVFQRESYGPSVAFASGWVLFAGIFTGSIAALAVPLCTFQIPTVLGAAGLEIGPDVVGPAGLTRAQWLAIGVVLTVTAVNTLGVRLSSAVQVLTTMVPFAAMAVGALLILVLVEGSSAAGVSGGAASGAMAWGSAWIDAYVAAYFAYSGWNAVIYVAGEVEDPGTTLPFGLIGGGLLVTVVYLVLCSAFVFSLGFGGLAEATEAGTAAAVSVLGSGAGLGVTAVIGVAILASINATVLGGARVAYAMANERAFPSYFSQLNARDVPARALWIQAAIACVMIATGTFEQIVDLVGLAMMFIGALTVGALWVLRWRRPEAERPYRAHGFPWFPAIYLVSSALVVAGRVGRAFTTGAAEDWYAVAGILLFVGALLVGYLWTKYGPSSEEE